MGWGTGASLMPPLYANTLQHKPGLLRLDGLVEQQGRGLGRAEASLRAMETAVRQGREEAAAEAAAAQARVMETEARIRKASDRLRREVEEWLSDVQRSVEACRPVDLESRLRKLLEKLKRDTEETLEGMRAGMERAAAAAAAADRQADAAARRADDAATGLAAITAALHKDPLRLPHTHKTPGGGAPFRDALPLDAWDLDQRDTHTHMQDQWSGQAAWSMGPKQQPGSPMIKASPTGRADMNGHGPLGRASQPYDHGFPWAGGDSPPPIYTHEAAKSGTMPWQYRGGAGAPGPAQAQAEAWAARHRPGSDGSRSDATTPHPPTSRHGPANDRASHSHRRYLASDDEADKEPDQSRAAASWMRPAGHPLHEHDHQALNHVGHHADQPSSRRREGGPGGGRGEEGEGGEGGGGSGYDQVQFAADEAHRKQAREQVQPPYDHQARPPVSQRKTRFSPRAIIRCTHHHQVHPPSSGAPTRRGSAPPCVHQVHPPDPKP